MSSYLANVYAELQRRHGDDLMMIYDYAPSYLSKIAGNCSNEGKVLFLYEEDHNKARMFDFISPSKLSIKKTQNDKDRTDLNLTGSPLKDDCCIVDVIDDISLNNLQLMSLTPWRLEEECHQGMNIDRARQILCRQEFQNSGSSAAGRGSVWVLCNGKDVAKTLLLQYEFDGGNFSRGIITCLGVVSASSVNTQSLLQQHLAAMRPGSVVETTIENIYRIKAHISLRCSWTTAGALPSLTELSSSCDVVLSQTFHVSGCGPLTQDFIEELAMLMSLRDDILSYKHAEQDNHGKEPLRCGSGIDMEELHESIYKAMTEISGLNKADMLGHELDSDLESVVHRAKSRAVCDLTDKLWGILKRCASYKDLKAAFNILFQCAARCNIVNTPADKNRLAQIIIEVSNKRLAIPCLTGCEPLELLLEIGIGKLFKDYEYIFTQSKICSATNLRHQCTTNADERGNGETAMPNVRKSLHNAIRPDAVNNNTTARKTFLHNKSGNKNANVTDVVGFRNSHFCERETGMRLSRLWQIHSTLEHLLMIHIHLNLNVVGVCEQILKKSPGMIQSIGDSMKDEIELSISAHEVREQLEGKDPHSRRITMKSKNEFRELNSTFYYNMDNILPPSIIPDEKGDLNDLHLLNGLNKETIYYGWLYRRIKTLK